MIQSYGSIYSIGHRATKDIFNDKVQIEEKVDGSFLGFGILDGELSIRSKKIEIHEENAGMFQKAVDSIKEREHLLTPGFQYYGEFLNKPKHNSICYDRIPRGHIVIFDIMIGDQDFLPFVERSQEAGKIGLEYIPVLSVGKIDTPDDLTKFLDTTSFLGGSKIEGIVIKRYNMFLEDKKYAKCKFISEKFKEVHNKEWKKNNPNRGDIIDQLINKYKTEARWKKAISHMKERGEYEGSPRDIGPMMKEIQEDVKKECKDEIAEALFDFHWKKISRGITAGSAEWLKEQLIKEAFE